MRLSLITLGVIFGLTLAAPWLAPHDPMRTYPEMALSAPTADFPFGTDLLGRDILSRVLYGGRHTLLIAAAATGIAMVPAVLVGVTGGRWVDPVIVLLLNGLLAIPSLLMALVVLTVLGSGQGQLALAVGIAHVAQAASVVRSAVRAVRGMEYVEGARAVGATQLRIIRLYILPGVRPTVLAYTGVIFAYSLMNSAALSFLGLRGDPGVPDWGVILAEGRLVFRTAPWATIVPGLAITLTVMAVNGIATRYRR
jgi:peptide/nickel transport system permease protein